jgi:hypothetical protein
MDAIKAAAQLNADRTQHMMDTGVGVLTQLSNKSHEEQLRQMQERVQTRAMQARNQPKRGKE